MLKTHFEEIVHQKLPFKIDDKDNFLKYCDPSANRAFFYNFDETPNTESSLHVKNMVSEELSILKNSHLKDFLKHFDFIRTQENLQSTFIDNKDLS